jgi:hypothetical protein
MIFSVVRAHDTCAHRASSTLHLSRTKNKSTSTCEEISDVSPKMRPHTYSLGHEAPLRIMSQAHLYFICCPVLHLYNVLVFFWGSYLSLLDSAWLLCFFIAYRRAHGTDTDLQVVSTNILYKNLAHTWPVISVHYYYMSSDVDLTGWLCEHGLVKHHS